MGMIVKEGDWKAKWFHIFWETVFKLGNVQELGWLNAISLNLKHLFWNIFKRNEYEKDTKWQIYL
jgi:hypothetical protein